MQRSLAHKCHVSQYGFLDIAVSKAHLRVNSSVRIRNLCNGILLQPRDDLT